MSISPRSSFSRRSPTSQKKSSDERLQEAFTTHHDEAQEHVARLERIFEAIGKKPRDKTCDAIRGIIAEGEEVIGEAKGSALRDAGMLAAAQAAEHYEIVRYGTLREWAKLLG